MIGGRRSLINELVAIIKQNRPARPQQPYEGR